MKTIIDISIGLILAGINFYLFPKIHDVKSLYVWALANLSFISIVLIMNSYMSSEQGSGLPRYPNPPKPPKRKNNKEIK